VGADERKAVNIMGINSPEWAIAFYGAIFNNNVITGVYITNGATACQYQAQNSEAQVIIVDNLEQLKLYMSIIDKLPEVKAIVAWGLDKIPAEFESDSRIHTWKNFLALGEKQKDDDVLRAMHKQKPGSCAILIYTSGTTGNPKGVMLSHDNCIFNGDIVQNSTLDACPEELITSPQD
jgi:long-chain-fatty-acid--CoA ligase ACSBG